MRAECSTLSERVWLVADNFPFKELRRDDPRLDWKYPYTPEGSVRLLQRGKDRWMYVSVGVTRGDAAAHANRWRTNQIAKLQVKIDDLKKRQIVP